jgi:DHA2 family multidrug resistance protein
MLDPTTDQGRALLDAMVTQQAQVIAYQNDFKMLFVFTLISMPFVLIIGSSHTRRSPGGVTVDAHA